MPNFHHFSLFIGDTPLRGGAAAHRSVGFLSGSLSWALDFKKPGGVCKITLNLFLT